jgi:predicted Zn-dependent peptidase
MEPFQPAAEKDHAMINLTCLTKHLPNLSGLLAEILTKPPFRNTSRYFD